MATINKDNSCLFVTTVARNRLPVFRTDALKGIACRALDEARLNPVREGLVARAEDYRWSSARQ
jgi:hypothetical protein